MTAEPGLCQYLGADVVVSRARVQLDDTNGAHTPHYSEPDQRHGCEVRVRHGDIAHPGSAIVGARHAPRWLGSSISFVRWRLLGGSGAARSSGAGSLQGYPIIY